MRGEKTEHLKDECGIYCITNEINNKKYVGKSVDIRNRWYTHLSVGRDRERGEKLSHKQELYKDIYELGEENFAIEILEKCSKEELNEKEIYWIDRLDTFNNGYNNDKGGVPTLPPIYGEDAYSSVLTLKEVEFCRQCYKEGETSRGIYNQYFDGKITFDSFHRMWNGHTWKQVMPEVFNYPRPAHKVTSKDVRDIRRRRQNGETCVSIAKDYEGKIVYKTVQRIARRKIHKEVE